VLEVNLTGPFLCTKAAVPLMREQGGVIVNITSISAVRASTLRSAYGTSKAGLAHLTKQLAVELASLGIRVNGVAPGPVETAMAKAVHTPEIRADYHDAIPLNRYGLEEELAEAVFFLCSDRSSYITGQILAVDGDGWHRGVIGITATRVLERYNRPTIVISREGEEAFGSGRSIRAFHLLEAIESCSDLFSRYGGHAHACGFAMPAANVPQLRAKLDEFARARLTLADFDPLLDLDMRLGEASGAAVAILLLRAALACHAGMATFTEAGVSGEAK